MQLMRGRRQGPLVSLLATMHLTQTWESGECR